MKKDYVILTIVFGLVCVLQLKELTAQEQQLDVKAYYKPYNYGKFLSTTSTSVGLFMDPIDFNATSARLMIQKGWGDWIQLYSQNMKHEWAFHNPTEEDQLVIYHRDVDAGTITYMMYFNPKGQIGIGTSKMPIDAKLAVEGKIYAREIEVNNNSWPDYVFTPDYKMLTLSELEAYVNRYSHLPGIPSAETVSKEGINLGEMDGLLLQKVEELTLYVIELKKEIEELKVKQRNSSNLK
ncbi:MAG: hypothetical protein CO098_08090 [Bacteroidetes bacterium CG_4_9_14_3_um_filter_41_19]|nr:MAG: hypothetical protein CO098_08090 [Bacteroidetes bacterium CG_4_9_14_3_um_filter_41_19]